MIFSYLSIEQAEMHSKSKQFFRLRKEDNLSLKSLIHKCPCCGIPIPQYSKFENGSEIYEVFPLTCRIKELSECNVSVYLYLKFVATLMILLLSLTLSFTLPYVWANAKYSSELSNLCNTQHLALINPELHSECRTYDKIALENSFLLSTSIYRDIHFKYFSGQSEMLQCHTFKQLPYYLETLISIIFNFLADAYEESSSVYYPFRLLPLVAAIVVFFFLKSNFKKRPEYLKISDFYLFVTDLSDTYLPKVDVNSECDIEKRFINSMLKDVFKLGESTPRIVCPTYDLIEFNKLEKEIRVLKQQLVFIDNSGKRLKLLLKDSIDDIVDKKKTEIEDNISKKSSILNDMLTGFYKGESKKLTSMMIVGFNTKCDANLYFSKLAANCIDESNSLVANLKDLLFPCFRSTYISKIDYFSQALPIQLRNVKVERAREPVDIIWENLAITHEERKRRRGHSIIISVMLLLTVFITIYSINLAQIHFGLKKSKLISLIISIMIFFFNFAISRILQKYTA